MTNTRNNTRVNSRLVSRVVSRLRASVAAAPSLSALSATSPSFVSLVGSTVPIVVSGSDLADASAVALTDGTTDYACLYTVDSSSQITITRGPTSIPAAVYGLKVTTPGGSATLASAIEAMPIVFWRRAGLGQTLATSSITAETDLSGTGLGDSQATSSEQPTYAATSATWNSAANSSFDGGDMLSTGNSGLTSAYAVIGAYRFTGGRANQGLWRLASTTDTGTNTGHAAYLVLASNRIVVGDSGGAAVWYEVFDATYAENTKYILSIRYGGPGAVGVRRNGVAVASGGGVGTAAHASATYPIRVGGGFSLGSRLLGDQPELVVVTGSPTNAQYAKIEGYLNARLAVF